MKHLFILISLFYGGSISAQFSKNGESLAHTFSIVARDPVTGEMGVAVQSHWFSVGTSVSWAEAGVGAIATQSFINKSFGPRGLAFLKSGFTAQQTLDTLLSDDPGKEVRQLAIVDSLGNVAVYTGKNCIAYASDETGESFCVQSNMMLTDKVTHAMAVAYSNSKGRPLAERLLKALDAAQAAGGDIRGRQSAAIIIVPAHSSGKPWEERSIDLRVDDSDQPLKELNRLYLVAQAYEHMNNGDLAVEKNDMPAAMEEYGAAMKLMPENLEMQYWTAITLANNHELAKAIPILKKVYKADGTWKLLTARLAPVGLLTVSAEELKELEEL